MGFPIHYFRITANILYPLPLLKYRAFLEENFMLKYRQKQAFTLSELLVVVAIVGILVAISIPVFASQREKARRAVDMDTARKIKSALVLAYNNEEIQVPKTASSNGYGTWVMLCNGTTEYAP